MSWHDNALAHTAIGTKDFLEQNNIKVVPWPALNPDLKPIELFCDEVQRRLNKFQSMPTIADKLAASFPREWDDSPITFINRLINSMNRRSTLIVVIRTTECKEA